MSEVVPEMSHDEAKCAQGRVPYKSLPSVGLAPLMRNLLFATRVPFVSSTCKMPRDAPGDLQVVHAAEGLWKAPH